MELRSRFHIICLLLMMSAAGFLYAADDTRYVCPGETFTWERTGKTYGPFTRDANKVDKVTVSTSGFSVTYNLQIKIYKTTYENHTGSIDLVHGTTHSFNGKTYSLPGIYYDTTYHEGGCIDKVYTITISADTSVSICSGSSFYWDRTNQTYKPTHNTSYTKDYTVKSLIDGKNRTYSIKLTINLLQPTKSTTNALIDEGESFLWFGNKYYSFGTYRDTLPNHLGCDSIGTLNLTVCQPLYGDTIVAICNGASSVNAWGETFYAPDTRTRTYKTTQGCDSIVTLHVIESNPADSNLYVHVNNFYYWSLNKTRYTESTTETVIVKTKCGCDSTITLHLTINKVDPTDTAVTICTGDSFDWHGILVSKPGTYEDSETHDILRLGVFPTPTIHISGTKYIDEGQSVALSVEGADYYRWEPTETLSSEWADSPLASPSISTTYIVHGFNAGDANAVASGDFELGPASIDMFYTEMAWATRSAQYGSYIIDTNCRNMPGWNSTTNPGDHTSGSGYYMIADGFNHADGIIWQDTVDVIPNNDYVFSAWFISLYTSVQNKSYSKLQFFVNGKQIGDVVESPHDLNTWKRYYEQWHNDTCTTAVLTIMNQNTNGAGNDFGLDDILFQDLSNCSAMDSITVIVNRYFEFDSTVYASQLPIEWGGLTATHEGDWKVRFYSPFTGYNDSVVTMHLHVLQDYNITIHRECYTEVQQRDAGEYPDYTVAYQADSCVTTDAGMYRNGDLLHLNAVSDDNCYVFDHWQDGNTDNPRTVKVSQEDAYTAYFRRKPFVIQVIADNPDHGEVDAMKLQNE